MRRRFSEHDLERRPDMCLEEVTAQGGSVASCHGDMNVKHGFAGRRKSDVADAGHDLDLFRERISQVFLRIPVEPSQDDIVEGANGREAATLEVSLRRKLEQAAGHFVPDVEDEHVGAPTIALVQQLRSHGVTSGRFGSRATGIAMSDGPSVLSALLNACLISSLVFASTDGIPYPFAVATKSNPG